MICQSKSCGCELVKSNLPLEHDCGFFMQNYYCFCCNTLYTCFSKYEDMSQGELYALDRDEY